jgi:hypothetical protein
MSRNSTNDELTEIARIAREQGLIWAQTLKEHIETGELDPNKPVRLLLKVGEIKPENFSLLSRIYMGLGSSTSGIASNSVIVGLGIYTGVSSAFHYGVATDQKAKGCYALSVVFSTSAMTSGGMEVAARTCQLSRTAVLSEAVGWAFMSLGNKLHVSALQFEGKPVPPHLRKYMNKDIRPPAYNPDGMGFIMPRPFIMGMSNVLEKIPFEKIGRLVGVSIAVYSYGKIIVIAYRYTQQFISKFKQQRKFKLLRKQAMFLITEIYTIKYRAIAKEGEAEM